MKTYAHVYLIHGTLTEWNGMDPFPYSGVGGETPTLLGPLERVNLNPPNLRTETDPVSITLYFLVFRIPDNGQSSETQ
jgi:hypothetical protein